MLNESQNIEYKESWRDEYLKWICGFANAQGGIIYIGINDRKQIVGAADSKRLMEDIPNKVRDVLGIIVDVNLLSQDEKEYLEIKVEPSAYPINYKGQYHYRSGSTKQELRGAALDTFLLRHSGKTWDGVPMPHITLNDFDTNELKRFRQYAKRSGRISDADLKDTDEELLIKLRLREQHYYKRAAVLLFNEDPEQFITGAYIKIARFGANDADLLYQDEIHGPLLQQATSTLDLLLTKYMQATITYDGLQRIETYPIPKAALREILMNAIVHKDYARAVPIQISVYSDRIMVWNPGQLPDGWNIDSLRQKHSSLPYNPVIANVFFRAGEIESWGRGIERVFDACKSENIPEPTFSYDGTGLWSTFTLPSNNLPINLPINLPNVEQDILKLIATNPEITYEEMAKNLQRTRETIRVHIRKLQAEGLLRREGSKRKGYWILVHNANDTNAI